MLRMALVCVSVVVLTLSLPAAAAAQNAMAGIVRDDSGAVLPGVTVEASSPALIEKVRSTVTDGAGQYRIVDLRPGTYSVTFTLAGFSTLRRDGVELTGNATATVNADLRVGTLAETITVTGQASVVDVQNARQQLVTDRDAIAAIPTARAYQNVVNLMVGVSNPGARQDVGGVLGDVQTDISMHGSRPGDQRLYVDGLTIGAPERQGTNQSMFVANVGSSQEIVISASGGLGETQTGGPAINIVPREGSNAVSGTLFATYAGGGLQASNYTEDLKSRGLLAPNKVEKVWDLNPSVGGPLVRDRFWFFFSGRKNVANNYVAGIFENKNAGKVDAWTYDPDLSKQALLDSNWWSLGMRLTLQASQRNKFNFYWDEQMRCVSCTSGGVAGTTAPEASVRSFAMPNRVQQVTWTSPLSNRILVEAGWGTYLARWGTKERPANNRALIPVQEQGGAIPGLNYRAAGWFNAWSGTYTWRGAVSLITGAHNAKFGYYGDDLSSGRKQFANDPAMVFRFNNGIPNQVTVQVRPVLPPTEFNTTSFYAQDSWSLGRLTLQGGVRYDHYRTHFPRQQLGPSPYLSNGPIVFEESDGVNFKDVTPRMGASYDLFGTGRTALKINFGRYVIAQDGTSMFGNDQNPINRSASTVARAWTDGNRDYVPNCDLSNRAANGECGPMLNQNFGLPVFTTTYDPAITSGWGVRPDQFEFSTAVQHELLPRMSVNAGYYRRWFGNFMIADNLAVAPGDFDKFSITVVDSRLPDGRSTVEVFDVKPNKVGQVNEVITAAENYGKQTRMWHGVDVSVSARPRAGMMFQGGVSSGKTTTDICEVVAQLPERNLRAADTSVANNQPSAWQSTSFCHAETPFLTQFKGFGSYIVPRIDVLISATYQNLTGAELVLNAAIPSAVAAQTLGRPLSGGANITANLLPPGQTYGDRISQVDMRFAKVLRVGRLRTQIALDLFNAFNSNSAETYNQSTSVSAAGVLGAYLPPTGILPARFAKISGQIDF